MRPSPLVLAPGTRIENFEIETRLGRGGFGITYLATEYSIRSDPDDPEPVLRRVAVKEYFPKNLAWRVENSRVIPVEDDDLARSQFFAGLRAFLKEAQAIAKLDHPGIVRIHRVFESHGTAYYSMPYMGGSSLAALLKDGQLLSWAQIQSLLLPVLDAVDEAHRNGILHRDIKPDNILVSEDRRRTILIDFGAARQEAAEPAARYTQMGELVAYSPGYAPIEQYDRAASGNRHGFFTDVYALCATLYQAVTGLVPPEATQRFIEVGPGRADPMPPVMQACPRPSDYPPSLLGAIQWGLAVQPGDRPQSVTALREAIGDLHRLPPAFSTAVREAPAREETRFAPGPANASQLATVVVPAAPVAPAVGSRPPLYVARFEAPEGEWVQAGFRLMPGPQDREARNVIAVWDAVLASRLDFCLRVQASGGAMRTAIALTGPASQENAVREVIAALQAVADGAAQPCTERAQFDAILADFPRRRMAWAGEDLVAAGVPVLAPVSWTPVLGPLFETARRSAWPLAYHLNVRCRATDPEAIRTWRKQILRLEAAHAPKVLVRAQAAALQRYETSSLSVDEAVGCDDAAAAGAVRRRCEHQFSASLDKLGLRELPLQESSAADGSLLDEAIALGIQSSHLQPDLRPLTALTTARRPQDLPVLTRLLGMGETGPGDGS